MRKEWTTWRKLCRRDRNETSDEVVIVLRACGFMQPDGYWPTEKAIARRMARVEIVEGKKRTLWNKRSYHHLLEEERKANRVA